MLAGEEEIRAGNTPTTAKMQLLVIEELNLYVNSRIAKIIATLVVVCFIVYHGALHIVDGGDSCHRLLSDGRFQGSQVWQPYGCMLHTYTNLDARRCLRYVAFLGQENHIVFLGDSRIRQLYHAMVHQVAVNAVDEPVRAHTDLRYNDTDLHLNIEFLWRPSMDESVQKLLNQWKHSKKVPKLIIIGSATHTIKNYNASLAGLEEYKNNLTLISSALNQVGYKTRVLWMLQDPVVHERLKTERAAITNDQLDAYNMAAMEVLYGTHVQIWSSSRLVAQGSITSFSDGIHAGAVAVKYDTQILLNLYCNDHMNYNDGTCCNSRESITMMQITTFAALCTCAVIMMGVSLKQWLCGSVTGSSSPPDMTLDNGDPLGAQPLLNSPSGNTSRYKHQHSPQDVLMALGKMGLIMGYVFLCDRTNLFMKENKYFSQLNFWLPLGYVFALGLFFTEDTPQTRLLHRDMTDEWKGWMQLVILIYHMTGASQILPIYMHVRVLVSAYVFLAGYGHFSYYWAGRDMSVVRYCQIMFRLNFLSVILCLVMNRPYQFYYFVPLISFWYTVLHVTLVLPPRITRPSHANSEASPFNYLYSIVKFVGLGSVITILYLSEVFFEKIFVMRPWKALFVTMDDDIHEWWFRWQLDRYSLLYGMAFALLYSGLTQYSLIDDKSGSNLLSGQLALLVSFVGTIFIALYSTMTFLCTNKPDCNEIHPYVVWVPILGFIILRNMVGIFRTRYSTFFAWFGRISLELFVCQYHIWLAADTHGVLVLIPSYPVANVLVTSFIFLCISHEVNEITNIIVPFVVPNDSLKALRNMGVFVFLLIAIAVHDGMF